MDEIKSPFLVFQNFISPLLCEHVIDLINFTIPELNQDGKLIKVTKKEERAESILQEKFQSIIPQIQHHYNVECRKIESINFEWYPEESQGFPVCENSSYLRKKWVRTKDRDFSAILFFTDYNENVPFDDNFEVYGGKLEFPQWGFGFNPQRGTLIVYPSDPHFINVTTKIFVGNLFQAKIHVATQQPYLFDAKMFPGDFRVWFKDVT